MTNADPLQEVADRAFAVLSTVGGDPRSLPIPLQTVALIYSAQGVVDNGGFCYFFGADWPMNPPYSIFSDAYRRIGAIEAAEFIEKATAMFPFPEPHLHKEQRIIFMDGLRDEHEFFALGNRICGDEAIWKKLSEYVLANNLRSSDA